MVDLNAFPNLESLNIDFHDKNSKSQITGNFFKHLKLNKLQSLWAVGTNLSDDNALVILNWPALETVALNGVPLSEDVMRRLRDEKRVIEKVMQLKIFKENAKNPMDDTHYTYQQRLENLNFALEKGFISQEAYDWAQENGISVEFCNGNRFICAYLKNPKPSAVQEL